MKEIVDIFVNNLNNYKNNELYNINNLFDIDKVFTI